LAAQIPSFRLNNSEFSINRRNRKDVAMQSLCFKVFKYAVGISRSFPEHSLPDYILISDFTVKYGAAFHDFWAAPCAGDMHGRLID
jgi:hypothetical protein